MTSRVTLTALVLCLPLAVFGCGSDTSGGGDETGGVAGTGGVTTGGVSTTGGLTDSGGMTTGGAVSTGGATTGGVTSGGQANTGGVANSGGSPTGGVVTSGGTSSGGTSIGGVTSGGASTGGVTSGGASTGGVTSGGASTGGVTSGGQAGSSGSTGEGGTGGGSGEFNPCPTNGDPCRILPLGDSITHGLGSSDDAGYRSQLFALAVAANQSITFTGTLSNGPSQVSGETFPKSHDGHDGWTVEPGYSQYDTGNNQGVSLLVTTDKAFKTMPHIVLVHIGTNDLTSSDAKSTTSDRLDSLITKIVGVAPDALIVVAKVIPLGYSSSDWDNYNAKIPGIVEAHAANGEHIVMVDMSTLPSSQLNGVHPNNQGYTTMAGYWYESIKGYLPN